MKEFTYKTLSDFGEFSHFMYFYIIGLGLIGFGVMILYDPIFCTTIYPHCYDFSDIQWFVGIGSIIFGIYLIESERRPKHNEKAKDK